MIIIIVSAETDRLRNHKSPYFRQTDFQGPLALINRKFSNSDDIFFQHGKMTNFIIQKKRKMAILLAVLFF